MSDNIGKFVWYEWMGKDLDAASAFYAHVVGWKMGDPGMANFRYLVGAVGEAGVVGMLATPPEAQGAPPCWTGYVLVEDVDAAAEKLKAAGGQVMRPPMDIPHVGRFAIVTDPQGAHVALFKDAGGNPPPPPPPGTPGLDGWRELHALDGKTALDFYSSQFGWKEASQFDMGPMGVYRIYDIGGQQGGVMTKGQEPGPYWLFYFLVDGADAAAVRVKEKGGQVLNGPHEVPGGMWALQCADAEGAAFGLVAAKR